MVLRELAEDTIKPHPIIYQQPWLVRVVPADGRLAHVMLIYRKGQTEDSGN